MSFEYDPPTGLLDTSVYPDVPASPTAARQQFMDLFYQARDQIGNLSVFVNIKSYGVTGDGTDESTKIQQAIDTVSAAGGGVIFFPRGTYKANITIKSRVHLIGESRDNTVIQTFASTGAVISTPSTLTSYWKIKGLSITASPTVKGIYFQRGSGQASPLIISGVSHVEIEDCIINGGSYCMYFEGGNGYQFQQWINVRNVRMGGAENNGIYATGGLSTTMFDNVYIASCKSHGLYFDEYLDPSTSTWCSPTTVKFNACIFEAHGQTTATSSSYVYGAYIKRCDSVKFDTCWFEGNGLVGTTSYGGAAWLGQEIVNVVIDTPHTASHSRHFHLNTCKGVTIDNVTVAHNSLVVTNYESVIRAETNTRGRIGRIVWLFGQTNLNPLTLSGSSRLQIEPVNNGKRYVAVTAGSANVTVTLPFPEHHAFYVVTINTPSGLAWAVPNAARFQGSFRVDFSTPPAADTYFTYEIYY